ncbi:transposase [Burkholderia sp. PU8-34]
MQPHPRKAELNRIEGAESFDYDNGVPYDRLDEKSIATVIVRANLAKPGIALARSIRNSPPDFAPYASREYGNIVGGFNSRIMRLLMQFPSVGVGLLAFLFIESPIFNPRVLEVWDNVAIPDVVHERTRTGHKVHGLLVEPDGFVFFEYRPVDDLLKKPALYQRIGERWDSPKLREAAARYGFGYRLVTDKDLGRVTAGNLSHLRRAYEPTYPRPTEAVLSYIVARVTREGVVSWQSLNDEGISGDAIRYAIAHQFVWYPLREEDLTLEIAYLYASQEEYLIHRAKRIEQGALAPALVPRRLPVLHEEVVLNEQDAVVVQTGDVFVFSSPSETVSMSPRKVELAVADGYLKFKGKRKDLLYNLKQKQIDEGCALILLYSKERSEYRWPFGVKAGQLISPAQIARHRAKLALAKSLNISPLILLARNHNGNAGIRSLVGEGAVYNRVIYDEFLTSLAPTPTFSYGKYTEECEKEGVLPTSERNFFYRIARLKKYDVVILRKGEFAGYKYGAYIPAEEVTLLTKGRLPGEVCHIDTTPFPVTAINPFTKQVARRRLQLAIVADACNDDVPEHLLYYGHPGYRATFRIITRLVEKYGALPQYLVVDHGPEHIKKQLQLVLGRYGVIVLFRPVKKPRAGQPVEGAFSALMRSVLRNWPGYRDPNDNPREQPVEFRPSSLASLTLTDCRQRLAEHFARAWTRPSAKTGGESIAAYNQRRSFSKGSAWQPVEYTGEFRFLMMPYVDGDGRRLVDKGGGLRHQYITYWAPELADPKYVGKRLEVHEDPDNIGHVYVFLEDNEEACWVECTSLLYEQLKHFTADERDEYLEHRRLETKSKSRKQGETIPGLTQGRLAAGLRDWTQTEEGAEAHSAALQNQNIEVDKAFLELHGLPHSASGATVTKHSSIPTTVTPLPDTQTVTPASASDVAPENARPRRKTSRKVDQPLSGAQPPRPPRPPKQQHRTPQILDEF